MGQSKAGYNRKKSKQGNKHYFGKHKLSHRETNFRLWLERDGLKYSWFRTLPPAKRLEFRKRWYAELDATDKSAMAPLPKKHRA